MRYAFSDCLLDTDALTLTRQGVPVPVEPQVFDLIRLLAEMPHRIVTRDEIVTSVWGGRIVSESAISARIAAARKAVGDDGKRQAVIRTVARRGLQMVAPVETDQIIGDQVLPDTPRVAGAKAPPVRYTRNADGHTLAWTACGEGPSVLRIGGPMINVAQQWTFSLERTLFDAITPHHRLLQFDGTGFGLSEAIPEPFDHTRLVGDCLAVADAAGTDRFAVFVESGASLIGVRLAALYPERVSKLVLVGGYVDGRSRRNAQAPPDSIRAMIKEGWSTHGNSLALAFLFSYFPEGPHDALQTLVKLEQATATEEIMLGLRDAVNNDSIAEFLPRVQCPTLIVQGRDNSVHPLSEAMKLAAGIPNAELVVLETANHVPLPGNSVWAEYLDTLLGFLADRAGPTL